MPQDQEGQGRDTRSERVLVEQPSGQRPFMRGIMVHSLTARGVTFEDALRTADEVSARIRGRGVVSRLDLAKMVQDVLGEKNLSASYPPTPLPATIRVGSEGEWSPFSKGALSQSLLAASIDPSDAFEVAREIELELVRRGIQRITRRELRVMAHERLGQRFGEKKAERYLVWRKYAQPERPVIVLLGGTTGAGKTSLALEVARRLGIRRVMSTDSIRQVMRIMLSPELMPAIHASSFDAYRYIPDTATSEEPVIEGCMAQAAIVSVGVRGMLDRAVAENTSMVLDGVTMVPGLIDLSVYEDVADVIYLVVTTLDEQAFRSRFAARGDRQSQRGTHRYVENLEAILRIQEHFLELADRFDVPIVDNTSIDDCVPLIIQQVVETLRNKGDFDAREFL